MTIIHVKPPYAPAIELSLPEVNAKLQDGSLPIDSLAWTPGMNEWVPLKSFPGIAPVVPPPLPKTAKPETIEPAQSQKTKKLSLKSIVALISVVLGALLTFSASGLGLVLLITGVVVGWFASRDFKARPEQLTGKGALMAARVLILLFCGLFLLGLLSLVIPACSSALEKSRAKGNSEDQTLPSTSEKSQSTQGFQQSVTGRALPYSISVPEGWSVEYNKGIYDIRLHKKHVFLGIIVQKESLGSPEQVASLMKANMKAKVSDIAFEEKGEIEISGRRWVLFTAEGSTNERTATYMVCVTSTENASYEIVGWTTSDLFQDYADTIYEAMKTFRFPD